MSAAFHFGRSIKRAFYVSPDMFASGNIGTVVLPKKRKKKKQPVNDTVEKETTPEKSAAYFFGAWMKQAQNPGQIPSGTLSLNNPGQIASPSITVSGGTQGPNTGMTGAPKPSGLPQAPTRSWGGYLTDTNNGLAKDVGDYFTHTLPQTFNPWSEAYQTADARFKNLPADQWLRRGAQASAAVGAAAGVTAAALPAVAPGLASASVFGTGGATAGTVAGGVGAGSQTPAGQNFIQRVGQTAGNVVNSAQRAVDMYQRNVAPTLERLNYKPEDVLHDTAAVVTGNVDHVKGPNWNKGMLPSGLPQGAPSLPRPLAAWKSMYGSAPGMLPGAAPAGTAMAHAGMQ